VVEIGTGKGLSALSMLTCLSSASELISFDIMPWVRIAGTYLRPADFSDGRLQHVVGDLASRSVFRDHADVLSRADLIFVDGPKDGRFEACLLKHLEGLQFTRTPLVVFDDTRLLSMLGVWRGIRRPKMDFTSIGHWSGTGIVDWLG
jgi:predicted O-methyltransferase YrrM